MTEKLKTINVHLENPSEAIFLFGNADVNLKIIEQELKVSIVTRGETVHLSGDEEKVSIAGQILDRLLFVIGGDRLSFKGMCYMPSKWHRRVHLIILPVFMKKKSLKMSKERRFGLKPLVSATM